MGNFLTPVQHFSPICRNSVYSTSFISTDTLCLHFSSMIVWEAGRVNIQSGANLFWNILSQGFIESGPCSFELFWPAPVTSNFSNSSQFFHKNINMNSLLITFSGSLWFFHLVGEWFARLEFAISGQNRVWLLLGLKMTFTWLDLHNTLWNLISHIDIMHHMDRMYSQRFQMDYWHYS